MVPRQPPSETADRRHVNCTSPLSPRHFLWGPIRHFLRAEFLNLYGEMCSVVWELNFRYVPLSLRETLHVLLSSQSETTPNLDLGVPLCLRETWRTHLSPSEISVRVLTVDLLCATWHQRVFLYYKRNKQTNTLNILAVTWRSVYIITFRVFTTCSYVGGFHVSKEHDASLFKVEGLCQILTLKRYIRCLQKFSLGASFTLELLQCHNCTWTY